ncbi:MAG: hypothetical protein ACRDRG_04765 [Pseudonocardiaceae bacterium]
MTEMQRHRGEDHHGDADDQPAGEVDTEGIPSQLRRRRAASWRLEPLARGYQDPWRYREELTPRRLAAWRAAWRHLRCHGLQPVVPEQVRRHAGGDPT